MGWFWGQNKGSSVNGLQFFSAQLKKRLSILNFYLLFCLKQFHLEIHLRGSCGSCYLTEING